MALSEAQTLDDKARQRFEADTAEHQMTVLRDDGLYRHLRFAMPGTMIYHYDLVTWPGYLAYVGDMGDYVFSRLRDMFQFFEQDGNRINPQYWAEKLRGPGRDMAREYSADAFRARVLEWFTDMSEDMEPDEAKALRAALDEQVLDDWRDVGEEGAHRLLRDFDHDAIYMHGSWEWDLREYDGRFLWACWAITRGIARYRSEVTGAAS